MKKYLLIIMFSNIVNSFAMMNYDNLMIDTANYLTSFKSDNTLTNKE